MKNILSSLLLILLAAALVAGGTYSFFNDTETSEGNTFTAGSIDLRVDSEGHYGGMNCEGEEWVCDEWADEAVLTLVDQGLKKGGAPVDANRSNPSVALGEPESDGDDFESAVIGTFYSLGFGGEVVYRFENYVWNGDDEDLKIYEITGGSSYPMEKAKVAVSQDSITWYVYADEAERDHSFDLEEFGLPWIQYVRVTDTTDASLHNNSADGYDLDAVEALHCSAPGIFLLGQACNNTWSEDEFDDAIHKFFSFNDVKPGDYGENTISLHVYDNDAWGQIRVEDIVDNEGTCVEPELDDDPTCVASTSPGDLRENMLFYVWLDQGSEPGFQNGDKEPFDEGYDYEEGDNIWQDYGNEDFDILEPLIALPGPIDFEGEEWELALALAAAFDDYCDDAFAEDFNGQNDYGLCHGLAEDGRLVASATYYFGVAWELPINTDNASQSDIFGADVVLVVEQHRNNLSPFEE